MTASGDQAVPLFDPASSEQSEVPVIRRGDQRPPGGYVYDRAGRIQLAVNVALVTGRPLLVRGDPGTGKSSLALAVADHLGLRYYAHTITSRTRARDLLWTYDAVRRLNDAQAEAAGHPLAYVTPGVLWWAFSPSTAAARGLSDEKLAELDIERLPDPTPRSGDRAVVLLDEIDKADPDLPNDLLTPLGSLEFAVTEVERGPRVVAEKPPLVVITTNEERDLPQAFVRRCVVLALEPAGRDRMIAVARAHFPAASDEILGKVLDAYEEVRGRRDRGTHVPSLAEYLDAVSAVEALGFGDDDQWRYIIDMTLAKPERA
jgi:MoxR-like ATPase